MKIYKFATDGAVLTNSKSSTSTKLVINVFGYFPFSENLTNKIVAVRI